MNGVQTTRHAAVRMQQRSFSENDLNFILAHGEEIEGNGVFLSSRTVESLIRSYKAMIAMVERLRNSKVVIDGGCIITCHPCKDSELRRVRKRARKH